MQDITQQIMRAEALFDELHDYLCNLEGAEPDQVMNALKGALFCRGLYCDLVNEQGNGEG